MAQSSKTSTGNISPEPESLNGVRMSITTKLVLSFLLVIVVTGAIFTAVGIILISDHIETDAAEQAVRDLESAQDLYLARLDHLMDLATSTAANTRLQDAIASENMPRVTDELLGTRFREELDILTVTDADGEVLLRASDLYSGGGNIADISLVNAVMTSKEPLASTVTISPRELRRESSLLAGSAENAALTLPFTGKNSDDAEPEIMMLGASAPIYDAVGSLVGVVWVGSILNTSSTLICDLTQSLFSNQEYQGQPVGFVAIYQGDTAILACSNQGDATGLIGTLLTEEEYVEALLLGEPWISSDELAGSTYITAYEPIRNSDDEIVGVLQIGKLEQVYLDIRNQFIIAFLIVTLVGALVVMILAYYIAQRISGPIKELESASRNLASGDLRARIDTRTMQRDELAEMADAFNAMAAALQERDEKLLTMATTKISQAERLAIIGRLSAGVAHELNNPLQGIVTYSHLLRERMPADHPDMDYINRIAVQANRSRDIIRGLLDFARHGEHARSFSNVNIVLQDSISLVENQAIFHNILITKEFDAKLPQVFIDPSRIERVFINIIMNAAEAMDGEGHLTMRTRPGATGDYVVITISDTGHGISKEDMSRIFDPFFTTKEVGRGTGLGLAISYGIIQDHGGTISVDSRLGECTTFTIRLPIREGVKVPGGVDFPRGKELTLLSGL